MKKLITADLLFLSIRVPLRLAASLGKCRGLVHAMWALILLGGTMCTGQGVTQVHTAFFISAPVMIVDAQATTDVEVLEVEALLSDLLHKLHHEDCGVPEDVHLQVSIALAIMVCHTTLPLMTRASACQKLNFESLLMYRAVGRVRSRI